MSGAFARLSQWIVRRLPGASPAETPTATIYFTHPLRDLIGGPISRLTPSLFAAGDSAVVIRYARAPELRAIAKGAFRKIYLLMDDDLWALGEGLPARFRERLQRYRDGELAELLKRATHVVAPSPAVLARFPGQVQLNLQPAQIHPLPSLDHHDGSERFEIIFSGTGSHREDLAFTAPAISSVLARHPSARLTTFFGDDAPRPLRGLPNAIHHRRLDWPQYRAFVTANRFHAAIAPALDTPFNRARSITRLHDNAAFGAAGLYSRQPPFEGIVGESGVMVENTVEAWRAALEAIIADRVRAGRLAAAGQTLSSRLGDPAIVRQFWMRELGLA